MRVAQFTAWLESQESLDRVGRPVNRAVKQVIRSGPLKGALAGTWLGHPAHPVVVLVPIGTWTSASLIDLSARHSTVVARRLIGVGLLAMIPAALTGLADWSDTAGAEQRIGITHAALNTVAVALYGASWWVRRRSGPSCAAGIGLAVAGLTAATAAGYLGGHMVYAQGVGIDTNAFHSGPEDWTTVAALRDLVDGEAVARDAGRTRVLLVLQKTQVQAIENRCSHRGGPLSDGTVDRDCVTCPWHGSRFRLHNGNVIAGPATVGQATYDTRIADDQVQVRRHERRALRTSPDGPG